MSEAETPARTELVTTPEALARAVTALARETRVAVDCESNGMHAYRARLCTVQLAPARPDAPAPVVYVIDTIAVRELAPLARLLGPHGPTAVLHDAFFDAFLLTGEGIALHRVFDTALHARFLGVRETGLASLLKARFEVSVSKALQSHDWSRRPLEEPHLNYLAADVRHLGLLAGQLEREARTQRIEDEIRAECEYLLANAQRDAKATPEAPHTRIKGTGELDAVGKSALRALAEVRETYAERWNTPPGRVVNNAALLSLARNLPRDEDSVRRTGSVHGRAVEAVPALYDAINRAREGRVAAEPPVERINRGPSPAERALRRNREQALTEWRKAEATERGVDPQAVLPGHAVADLAAHRPRDAKGLFDVPGLGASRIERYGAQWLALMDRVEHAHGRGAKERAAAKAQEGAAQGESAGAGDDEVR